MSYKLDYGEPIPKVVERLRSEHELLKPKLLQIQNEVASGNLNVAQSLLNSVKTEILRHAVEEEARLVRIIIEETQKESEPVVEITRYHRRVSEFLERDLPRLLEMPRSRARQEMEEFVRELQKHQKAEERETFPLALKAYEHRLERST